MARAPGFKSAAAQSRYATAYDLTLAAAGVEVRPHDVPTRFGTTHVVEAGDDRSPPVVLLHTMSFSSTVWVRNLAALSREFRILAVDTIGDVNLSRSERPIRGRDDYAAWFADVLGAFGIGRAALVGNSYGGWLAASFALARPDMVSRLVLISPPLLFAKYRPGFYAQLSRVPFVRSEERAKSFARWFLGPGTLDDPAARLWLDQFSCGMPCFGGMAAFPRPKSFTDDELQSIAVPVLLVEGEHEPMHDPRAAIARAATLLPSVSTVLLPDTKHVAQLECPDRVNPLVLEHLGR